MDEKSFGDFINSHKWHFAKTYASWCPHEHTLKRESKASDFEAFALFIYRNGFKARFGSVDSYYYIMPDGWYYFVFAYNFKVKDGDVYLSDGCTLVNRASLKEFEFDFSNAEHITVKRLPIEQRLK